METCTVETGLLKKKPCGHASVTHCANCEQPLCKQHSVAQPREPGKPAKFMCKECDAARKAFEKNVPQSVPEPKKPAEEAAKPAAAAPAPAAPGAAATAAPKEAPKAAPEALKVTEDGALEFTPSKK
jgi:hypothetical protein